MTSLVAGFVCKVKNSLSNAVFLKQLVQIGFLAHFESLLSTNGRNFYFRITILSRFVVTQMVGIWPKRSEQSLALSRIQWFGC